MSDTKLKIYISDLRRTLYLMQLLRQSITDLNSQSVSPTLLKVNGKNIVNSINRFISDCQLKTNPETFAAVMTDLNSEQLKDMSLLIDTMSDVKNVGEITEILQQHKNAA